MNDLMDRLEKVRIELMSGSLEEEEREYLLQRAHYLIHELKVQYKVLTSI